MEDFLHEARALAHLRHPHIITLPDTTNRAIRVVQQYERGVIFVLSRFIGAKGPGIFLSALPLMNYATTSVPTT